MVWRFLCVTMAMLAISGCASSGYDGGYYSPYPAQTYYGQGYGYDPYYYGDRYYPYYGGGFGAFGRSDFDDDFDHRRHTDNDSNRRSHRFFRPEGDVTCDRHSRTCFGNGKADQDLTNKFFGKHTDRMFGSTEPPGRAMDNNASRINRGSQAVPRIGNSMDGNAPILLRQQPRPQGVMHNSNVGSMNDQSNRVRPLGNDKPVVVRPSGGKLCPPNCSGK